MNGVVFLAFTLSTCVPCQRLHADFSGRPEIVFIDAKASPQEAAERKVTGVPTVIATRNGVEIGRRVGYADKDEMEKWLVRKQSSQE